MSPTRTPRAAGVAATRAAICGAAHELLGAPHPTVWSMAAVAERAGVTRATVYNQFTSRGELTEAVLDAVVTRDRVDTLVSETADLAPRLAIEHAVATTAAFWHNERPLLRRLFATATDDTAIAAMLARREGWRREQWSTLLARTDVSAERMDRQADLLVALTSFPTWDHLVSLKAGGGDVGAVAGLLSDLATAVLDVQ